MIDTRIRAWMILVWVAFALLLLAAFGPALARSQDDDSSNVLALGQVYRHEANYPERRSRWVREPGPGPRRARPRHRELYWDLGDDMAAIHAVLEAGRARLELSRQRADPEEWTPVTFSDYAHRYSRRVFDRDRRDSSKCDSAHLDLLGSEPACWRHSVPWHRRRDAWLAILEHAREVRAGNVVLRCELPPHHWGCGERQTDLGCQDHLRAARAGWTRVSCGNTDNYFYHAPELARYDD